MVNSQLIGYNSENRAILKQLPATEITNFRLKEDKLLLEIDKNQSK